MSDLTLDDLAAAPSILDMVELRRHFWPVGTFPRCRRCTLYFGHEYDGFGHLPPGSERSEDA